MPNPSPRLDQQFACLAVVLDASVVAGLEFGADEGDENTEWASHFTSRKRRN
jgi:hypothetical protein